MLVMHSTFVLTKSLKIKVGMAKMGYPQMKNFTFLVSELFRPPQFESSRPRPQPGKIEIQ